MNPGIILNTNSENVRNTNKINSINKSIDTHLKTVNNASKEKKQLLMAEFNQNTTRLPMKSKITKSQKLIATNLVIRFLTMNRELTR